MLHVAGRTTTAYRGGYTAFVTQRAERQLALERQVAQQRKVIAKEEDYIRRNIAGQNSAQAKGRRARLARLPRLSAPPGEREAMSVRFGDSPSGAVTRSWWWSGCASRSAIARWCVTSRPWRGAAT